MPINWEPTRHKDSFLRSLAPAAAILDVGCGNNSPQSTKALRPDLRYVGLDVGDYNQQSDPRAFCDEYLIVAAEQFAAPIEAASGRFDAVVSCHNLEHCLERDRVLAAMLAALKPGGRIYLSFPCEASTRFPGPRDGCLNYYDDSSHVGAPPRWSDVMSAIGKSGGVIEFAARRYRPWPLALKGLAMEPWSFWNRRHSAGRSDMGAVRL